MGMYDIYVEDQYASLYREMASNVLAVTKKDGDGYISVDLPGLEGQLAFPVGGLTAIVGLSGSGKSVLCDNLVAKASVPVVYLPLQSTGLEAAHVRLSAADAGLDYWEDVVCGRGMAARIALAEASERIVGQGKVLVCLDEVTPSLLNEVLVNVIGESPTSSGTIDETADECLIVLDNIDMLATNGSPLWQRIQFLKDVVKGKLASFVVAVAGDADDLYDDLANADEVYGLHIEPSIPTPVPANGILPLPEPVRSRKVILRNTKTLRHDGHCLRAEFVVDLPTRTTRAIGE